MSTCLRGRGCMAGCKACSCHAALRCDQLEAHACRRHYCDHREPEVEITFAMFPVPIYDWYRTWHVVAIFMGIVFLILSMIDGNGCMDTSTALASCGKPEDFHLSWARQSEATILFVQALFMCYGLFSGLRPRLAWFFASATVLNTALGVHVLFLALESSTRAVAPGGFTLWYQRGLIVGSLSFSMANDLNLAIGFRDRRLPGFLISTALVGMLVPALTLQWPSAIEALVLIIADIAYVFAMLYVFLEVFRGSLDQWLDCIMSYPATTCFSMDRRHPNRDTESCSVPARFDVQWCCSSHDRAVHAKDASVTPLQDTVYVNSLSRHGVSKSGASTHPRAARAGSDARGEAPERMKSAPMLSEDRQLSADIPDTILGGAQHPYLGSEQDVCDESQHDCRCTSISLVHWMALVYIAFTASFIIEFIATGPLGVKDEDAAAAAAATDMMLVVLRCTLALVIVRADVTAVAKQAAEAYEWRRKATTARLQTIQQFTRYIFHEARVPLYAVSLAVDELGITLQEVREQSIQLRRRVGGVRIEDDGAKDGTAGRYGTEGAQYQEYLQEEQQADGEGGAAPMSPAIGRAPSMYHPLSQLVEDMYRNLEEGVDVLNSQKEGCKGLQHIFDDVLEAQRIEQGRLKLRQDTVSPSGLLRDIRTVFRRSAWAKRVKLSAVNKGSVPRRVVGDGVRIKQVLANLVSNAIKFTPAGGTIMVETWASEGVGMDGASHGIDSRTEGAGHVELPVMRPGTEQHGVGSIGRGAGSDGTAYLETASSSESTRTAEGKESNDMPTSVVIAMAVRDTGCGMTSEDINGLFMPYKQARHGVAYTGSSSGLGLYISRGIARQMGGDLVASSEGEGKGSVFTFTFQAMAGRLGGGDGDRRVGGETGAMLAGDSTMSRRWKPSSVSDGASFRSELTNTMGGRTTDSDDDDGDNTTSTGGEIEHTESEAVTRVATDLRRMLRATGSVELASGSGPNEQEHAYWDDKAANGKEVESVLVAGAGVGGDSAVEPTPGTYAEPVVILTDSGGTAAAICNNYSGLKSSGDSSGRAVSGTRAGAGAIAGKPEGKTRRRVVKKKKKMEKGTTKASTTRGRGTGGKSGGGSGPGWCLVVDDVSTNRKLLARGMRRIGFDTELAADGKEAVYAARARAAAVDAGAVHGSATRGDLAPLGLITMDKSMPVMDGIEATRAIRAEHGSRFLILGLTGDALGSDLESFKAAGLDGVLGKPASALEMYQAAVRVGRPLS